MLAIALAILAMQGGEPSCHTADSRIEGLISSKAAEHQGQEYCQFRLYHTVDDVDADGLDDFLVVFAVEALGGGGNGHIQYLAVFSSAASWNPALLRVGERGVRNITHVAVKGRMIVLTTAEQRRGDALCCPSGTGELRYQLKDGQLLKAAAGRPTSGCS
jgi:hypothetical protein